MIQEYNPQVQFDAWGNEHVVWGAADPERSGLQLFYSNDVSGRFCRPIQATWGGTVFDSTNAEISSFVFRLDRNSVVHLAYVANVQNRLQLQYTRNDSNGFAEPIILGEHLRYDMAVDSTGMPHVVWIDVENQRIGLNYWNPRLKEPVQLASHPCNSVSGGCDVGYPDVEVGKDGRLDVAFRADSSAYFFTWPPGPGSIEQLPSPKFDPNATRLGTGDLRIRMALDTDGDAHIIIPQVRFGSYSLVYVFRPVNGPAGWRTLEVNRLDSLPVGFDIACNAADRLTAVWTVRKDRNGVLQTRAVDFTPPGGWSGWQLGEEQTFDLGRTASPGGLPRRAFHVAARGDRVAVTTLATESTGDSLATRLGLLELTSRRPQIAYIEPDAAAAGMNVVVETVAPFRAIGAFGADGFDPSRVSLRLIDPADADRVVIGPTVVSWNGRLLSTMLFVRAGAEPGGVPIAVNVDGRVSNVDTFHIVVPTGGTFQGGGRIPLARSRRGVIVVDSLVLRNGVFTIDPVDVDPVLPGNQGMLPVTILSLGPVRIDSDAVLSVSAPGLRDSTLVPDAGPGGGGGGSGGWVEGGRGYTGGGGPGRLFEVGVVGASVGSGGMRSGRYSGGPGLAGTPGGAGYPEAPGGGGLGHPFGASGMFGGISNREPAGTFSGGFGGGSAGHNALDALRRPTGGGGGGNATPGGTGNAPNEESNGGWIVGTPQLVPLAGGSGGGGGGYDGSGFVTGGGGGGALALFSYDTLSIAGRIEADGAHGANAGTGGAGGGGGGAGGAIILGAKGALVLDLSAHLEALGGAGGHGLRPDDPSGGQGGAGRIRIDGNGGLAAGRCKPAVGYSGPSTGGSSAFIADTGSFVSGFGQPGSHVRLFVKRENGQWAYSTPIDTVVGDDGTWRARLRGDFRGEKIYLVAMQAVDTASDDEYADAPAWVMSSAGGNVIGHPSMTYPEDTLDFGCIHYDARAVDSIPVANRGESELVVSDFTIEPPNVFHVDADTLRIAPGDTSWIVIRFQPIVPVSQSARLTYQALNVAGQRAHVTLLGCALAGQLDTLGSGNLGAMCEGEFIDTLITLSNVGDAPLTVSSITADPTAVSVTVITQPQPPFTIPAGGSRNVGLRLAPHTYDTAGLKVIIESDGFPQQSTMRIAAVDGSPHAAIVPQLTFGPLELERGDSCALDTLVIRNVGERSMTIMGISIDPAGAFLPLISLPPGTQIAAGDSIALPIEHCSRGYSVDGHAVVRLRGEAGCVDTETVDLLGRVASTSDLVISTSHDVSFSATHVGESAPSDTIVVGNRGTADDTLEPPHLVMLQGGADSEFTLGSQLPGGPIVQGAEVRFVVNFTPTSAEMKHARVTFRNKSGTWVDSVDLYGRGVESSDSGLFAAVSRIDFDTVHVGDRSDRDSVRLTNLSSNPVEILSAAPDDPVSFQLDDAPLPWTLAPGADTVIHFRFTPPAEGRRSTSVTLVNTSSAPVPAIALTGVGGLEHAALDRTSIAFTCLADGGDSTGVVTVHNDGSWPLTISNAAGLDATPFVIEGHPLPAQVVPGGSLPLTVRYQGSTEGASTTLRLANSTGSDLLVALNAWACASRDSVRLWLSNTDAYPGDVVEIPVDIDLGQATANAIDYSITIDFDPTVLLPLVKGRSRFQPVDIGGSLSADASLTEVKSGRMRLTGTIAPGGSTGRLARIPLLALQSSVPGTELKVVEVGGTLGSFDRLPDQKAFFSLDGCEAGSGSIPTGIIAALDRVVPNPVTGSATIAYHVPYRTTVRISLYDANGTLVKRLVDGVHDAGHYSVKIDVAAFDGGAYFYEMQCGNFRQVRRMQIEP